MSGFEKYRASVSLWDTHLTVAEQEILFEHAYNAGFREASDKAATLPMRAMYDAGYEQGVAAERERCAGIADEYHQRDPVHFIANAIAAAIRRGE